MLADEKTPGFHRSPFRLPPVVPIACLMIALPFRTSLNQLFMSTPASFCNLKWLPLPSTDFSTFPQSLDCPVAAENGFGNLSAYWRQDDGKSKAVRGDSVAAKLIIRKCITHDLCRKGEKGCKLSAFISQTWHASCGRSPSSYGSAWDPHLKRNKRGIILTKREYPSQHSPHCPSRKRWICRPTFFR
jgi:hypothetical protein